MFVSVQLKLEFESREDKEKVLALMRVQSSLVRFIYNRLREGQKEKDIYNLARKYFKLLSWYISSAIQKAKSLPSSCESAYGRNPKQVKNAWQVLKVAVVLPLLGKSFVRDFSPLKSLLIEGKWRRRAGPLVPVGFAGATSGNTR